MSTPPDAKYQVLICDGPSCGLTYESELLEEALARHLEGKPELQARVTLCRYTCFGRCEDGPNMFVHRLSEGEDPHEEPDPDVFESERGFYPGMDEPKVLRVVEQHVTTGAPVDDLVDDY